MKERFFLDKTLRKLAVRVSPAWLKNFYHAHWRKNIPQRQGKPLPRGRLIIVSNRLPLTVQEENGKVSYIDSSGGLVSGLRSYFERPEIAGGDHLWVGWPGNTVAAQHKTLVREALLKEQKCLPVFFSAEEMDNFYYGFCNKTIWPLFHYFQALTEFKEEYWNEYQNINRVFCETILEVAKPGDQIWIQDYHLMLLPGLLREKMPELRIGFFLHIPFPFFEIFRLLPGNWRDSILRGLLGSDLIGFHTHSYVQYFLGCVLRILGYEHVTGLVDLGERTVRVESFPMGIDYEKFSSALKKEETLKEVQKIKENFLDKKLIFSVDRLDYTKGIYKRLQGYAKFLEKYPQWHGKVIMMIVIVPSRIGVDSYQNMKKQLDELIGNINGKYSALSWTPLVYQYRSLPFEELVSLYAAADVALVTPLRDGMNLIAKEYIACRAEQRGVLILSEMAGAAKELGEAVIINPNNDEEVALAIQEALVMPEDEQIKRNQFMQRRLKRYNVVRWVEDFLNALSTVPGPKNIFVNLLSGSAQKKIKEKLEQAKEKIVFLDYDGTLVPFANDPLLAKPSPELLLLLKKIDTAADLVLISGRDKDTLEAWFGQLNINLVAEHGVWVKRKGRQWRMLKQLNNDWQQRVLPLLEKYTDSLPGSFIENKEYSLSWHFRMADPEQCAIRKKELIDDLVSFTANIDVTVVQGEKVVEIRSSNINKGSAALELIARKNYDFILCLGDDLTDEDMFKALPEKSITIKVGLKRSQAKYNIRNHQEVNLLLKNFFKL